MKLKLNHLTASTRTGLPAASLWVSQPVKLAEPKMLLDITRFERKESDAYEMTKKILSREDKVPILFG